jgi:predicted enzyme related to lactoylglutathione lyase
MAEMTAYEPGTPSWVDLGSPDLPVSIAFYGRLFGWEAQDAGPDSGGYHMFTLRGKYVAGLGPLMAEGQPPAWTTYISVADADATVAAAGAASGAVIMPPMDVFDSGRMAILADPTGAIISLWQPNKHIGAQLVNEPGTLCWNELMTRDPDAAIEFYEKVFGWKAHASTDASPDMNYTEFKLNDRSIAGMMPMGDDFPAEIPANWLVYFAVADCDEAVSVVESAGGSVAMAPMDIPAIGRFATVTDPAGAVFSVIKLNEA